jgi:outer membrane receptor protein involved in Fe transport
VQRRNPVITDPKVRGYHVGQLLTIADGGYFFPARLDLDTLASKIDSTLIRDVVVLKGPYSVRYGPGFAFLDIETLGSPRYQNGLESHGSTLLQYKTNGDGWRGRQAFWGGDRHYGFRIGFDLLAGNDYRMGNGNDLISSFNSQNADVALGFDLSCDSRIELRALRQNQQDIELPGQTFDLIRGLTDAYTIRYTVENMDWVDRFTVDAWYNYTRFNGNNLSPQKQLQTFTNPQEAFTGITDGDLESSGFRAFWTWGKDKEPQLSVGIDLRYITQHLNEFDTILGLTESFPIPRSHIVDPGFFIDGVLPIGERFTLKGGFRLDHVGTDIDSPPTDVPGYAQIVGLTPGESKLNQEYELWAAYLTGEYKCTEHWTIQGGGGRAQRPPSLTELYAARPILAIIQNGLNVVEGNANLSPEQLWQIDLGMRADYETFRFGLSGFYAWLHNYVTFEELGPPPSGFQVNNVQFVNTNRASLAGFEFYMEYDLFDWLTPFATMEYVEGRDYTRNLRGTQVPTPPGPLPGSFSPQEPLPSIPPLEARLGLRIHEARRNPRWGMEILARMVAAQDRVALSLGEEPTAGFTVFYFRSYWQVNDSLLLTGGVENFGDRFYREHLDLRTGRGVFQPGYNFYFGAQMTY